MPTTSFRPSAPGFRFLPAVANQPVTVPVATKKSTSGTQPTGKPPVVVTAKRYSIDDNGGGYQGL